MICPKIKFSFKAKAIVTQWQNIFHRTLNSCFIDSCDEKYLIVSLFLNIQQSLTLLFWKWFLQFTFQLKHLIENAFWLSHQISVLCTRFICSWSRFSYTSLNALEWTCLCLKKYFVTSSRKISFYFWEFLILAPLCEKCDVRTLFVFVLFLQKKWNPP